VTTAYGVTNSTAATLKVIPSGSAYAAEILAAGTGFFWEFNETNATTAFDYVGSANGTNVSITYGNPGPQPGGFAGMDSNNLAYTFNGSSSEVRLPSSLSLNLSAFSIVAWIRSGTASPYQSIMAQGGSLWCFHLNGTAQIWS
jgi:hypothetical protein